LIDLTSEHAAWSLPSESLETLRAAFGSGWEVREVTALKSKGSKASVGVLDAASVYDGVEAYFGWGVPRKVVKATSGTLRWAHSAAAGVGASITPELRASGAVLTNSRGIHAEPVSDWVITAIGFCVRGFHEAVVAQRDHRWAKLRFTLPEAGLTEFSSLRVGVVGLGGIGLAVARKCHALGMEVRAVRRRASSIPPPGVRWVGDPDRLHELAAQSDVLVLALPHTGATAGLIGDGVLRALPRGAYLLNVSRGGIVDETALLEHLEDGHIRGCVLDVFAEEPLDPAHPFWGHPGVLVTPHVSAVSHCFWEREVDLMVENIGRFVQGDRLRNVVNLEAGY
jgi:phosphoglycerate dehydrogenase-like enzyme